MTTELRYRICNDGPYFHVVDDEEAAMTIGRFKTRFDATLFLSALEPDSTQQELEQLRRLKAAVEHVRERASERYKKHPNDFYRHDGDTVDLMDALLAAMKEKDNG